MSGPNHAVTFSRLGVSKSAIYQGPPTAFTIVEEPGHILHDPFSPAIPPPWLIASIDENGVQTPIRIRRDGDRLLVVAGRSRVRAALVVNRLREERGEPGRITIPYILDTGTDDQAERAKEIENFHRRFAGAANRAAQAARYKARGWTDEQIAPLVTVEPREVEQLMAVNQCANEVREAMEAGRIDWRLATDFAALSRADQVGKLAQLVAGGTVKGRKARDAIQGKPSSTAPRPPTLPALTAMAGAVNGEMVRAGALLAYLSGGEHDLPPDVVEKLEAARKAVKPGVKPGKASAS